MADVVVRDYRIAGRKLRLRFAGSALVDQTTAALAHARTTASEPELKVDLWDSESTGQPRLRPAWGADAYLHHGAIDGFYDERLQVIFSHGSAALTVTIPDRGRAIYWISSAARFPDIERGSPLRTLIHQWLSRGGLQLVHAAALGGPEGCVLVVGRGGSGKSSTALACLDSDLGHLADD